MTQAASQILNPLHYSGNSNKLTFFLLISKHKDFETLKFFSPIETENIVEIPHKSQKDEDVTQDYEEWKRKILENAAKAQKATTE